MASSARVALAIARLPAGTLSRGLAAGPWCRTARKAGRNAVGNGSMVVSFAGVDSSTIPHGNLVWNPYDSRTTGRTRVESRSRDASRAHVPVNVDRCAEKSTLPTTSLQARRIGASIPTDPHSAVHHRSEERRVGKECRYRWWP